MFYSVSVIIPTYRRTVDVLERAVDSVLKQTCLPSDIIVVDDNSEDSLLSQDIEAYCRTCRLRYILSGGLGGAGARNHGIQAAFGEYVAFLDDDDQWLPEKLEMQLPLFVSPDVGLVYSRGYTVTEGEGCPMSRKPYATDAYYKTEVCYQDLLLKNYIGTTTQLVVRRSILQTLGGFDESLPSRQDYDLCLRIAKVSRCVGADCYLFVHNIHTQGQITADPGKNMIGYEMLLNKYREDICQVKGAYRNFCYRIARCARAKRNYAVFTKYLLLALLNDPAQSGNTIKKCFNLKL